MTLREKFEDGLYLVNNVPITLYADHAGEVLVNEVTPYPDAEHELECHRLRRPVKDLVPFPVLVAKSYGKWSCRLSVIHSKHFESRETLEDMLVEREYRGVGERCINMISIREALKLLNVDLSVNTAESGHNFSEKELFYKTMCTLFGPQNSDDTSHEFMLRDFKILLSDGNTYIATARRGDNYLIIVVDY